VNQLFLTRSAFVKASPAAASANAGWRWAGFIGFTGGMRLPL
jgi:hypothetical protein